MFLSAPLNYRRISSFFTLARFHPILRYWRPHLAVDYSAPIGTPIDSVADGIVIYKGWKGGYGNYLEIKHNNVYTTTYGHLSGFARNIQVGKRVRQGQLIGYVGSTGLSTGAHLCFRTSKNGQYVNFLKLKSVAQENIIRRYRSEFTSLKQERLRQLASLSDSNLRSFTAEIIRPGTELRSRKNRR
jgi:murein DD-endopeptidase MepM/ murein hydrolase activator NlpD